MRILMWLRAIPLIFTGLLVCAISGEPIYGIELLEDGTIRFITTKEELKGE